MVVKATRLEKAPRRLQSTYPAQQAKKLFFAAIRN
jgi:hypothetical protein